MRIREEVTLTDLHLTADQLDEKYNPEGDGEHPYLTRAEWRWAVENEETLSGYWDWVVMRLWEEAENGNEHQTATG